MKFFKKENLNINAMIAVYVFALNVKIMKIIITSKKLKLRLTNIYNFQVHRLRHI